MNQINLTLTHVHAIDCALESSFVHIHEFHVDPTHPKANTWAKLAKAKGIHVSMSTKSKDPLRMRISWQVFEKWNGFRSEQPPKEQERFLFLDHLQDPQNVGNILRTAKFFGLDGVVLPRSRSVKLGETVVRASTGGALGIPIIHCGNLADTIKMFQKEGGYVWGLDANAEHVLKEETFFPPKIGLVIGSEGEGMSKRTMSTCDQVYKLSHDQFHESLNASSAAAIAIDQYLSSPRSK